MDADGKVGKVAIIGLGLMGGSLAWALRRAGWEVRGFDRDADSVQYACDRRIIHRGCTTIAAAVAGADLVCFATPPAAILPLIREAALHLPAGCLVTDISSTKGNLVPKIEDILFPSTYYVGGHPMAGSERMGIRAASPYLLVGVPYILTPTARTAPSALEAMEELVRSLRAKPLLMTPAEHDYWVAGVSHVPHILAAVLSHLGRSLDEDGGQVARLAAGSYHDTTRVASSDPLLWRDICLGNREQILVFLQALREIISDFESKLAEGSGEEILQFFTAAKEFRDGMLRGGRNNGPANTSDSPSTGHGLHPGG